MDTLRKLLRLETSPDGDFLHPGFSHSEALHISGLTAERLLTWYKRDASKMPKDLAVKPGRGNRRRYDILQVAYLSATRALADVGVPVSDALALGSDLRDKVMGWLLDCEDLRPEDAGLKLRDAAHPWIAVFAQASRYDGATIGRVTYAPFVVSAEEYAYMRILDRDTTEGIREMMRDQGLASISLIDTVFLAVTILDRIIEVTKTRT
jgi:hypothetical protein